MSGHDFHGLGISGETQHRNSGDVGPPNRQTLQAWESAEEKHLCHQDSI